jgi:hypothetical protein
MMVTGSRPVPVLMSDARTGQAVEQQHLSGRHRRYRRGDLFDKCVALMDDWTEFLGRPAAEIIKRRRSAPAAPISTPQKPLAGATAGGQARPISPAPRSPRRSLSAGASRADRPLPGERVTDWLGVRRQERGACFRRPSPSAGPGGPDIGPSQTSRIAAVLPCTREAAESHPSKGRMAASRSSLPIGGGGLAQP